MRVSKIESPRLRIRPIERETAKVRLVIFAPKTISSADFALTEQKAAGFFSNTGTTNTIGFFTEDFLGAILIQATVDTTPTDSSWFTVHTFNGDGSSANDSTAKYWNEVQNVTGRFTWIRAKVTDFTQGVILKVTVSY